VYNWKTEQEGKKENKLKKKKEGRDWDGPAKDDGESFEFASI